MKNQEVAQILFEIGEFLELQEVPFKPQAYQQAAVSIDNLEEDINNIYNKEGIKGLKRIPAIGESIALKIERITFVPEYIQIIKVPLNKPMNKAEKTSLKIKANNIAINGGIIDIQRGIGFIVLLASIPSH